MIRRVLAHHAEQTRQAAERTGAVPAPGYRPETLQVLFGSVHAMTTSIEPAFDVAARPHAAVSDRDESARRGPRGRSEVAGHAAGTGTVAFESLTSPPFVADQPRKRRSIDAAA